VDRNDHNPSSERERLRPLRSSTKPVARNMEEREHGIR
jgi:hypothetical protein